MKMKQKTNNICTKFLGIYPLLKHILKTPFLKNKDQKCKKADIYIYIYSLCLCEQGFIMLFNTNVVYRDTDNIARCYLYILIYFMQQL